MGAVWVTSAKNLDFFLNLDFSNSTSNAGHFS